MQKAAAIAASVVLLGIVGGTYVVSTFRAGPEDAFAACAGSAVGGAIGGPFELVSETGATVTDADVITGPTLVYFGYTFCPDVCPLDAYRNGEATALLDERGVDVTPVFITVDPQRDTPEVVADFTDNFHERMLGLTGSEEQIRQVAQAYKTVYRAEETDDEFYLVDHMTMTYLMFPERGFVDVFRREVTAEQMADRVQCFVDAAS